jgi:hypothetical protein
MPVCGSADEPLLHGRRSVFIDEDAAAVDAAFGHELLQDTALCVGTNYTAQTDLTLERLGKMSNAGRAAESNFFLIDMENKDRCLRAHPVSIAPSVGVEDQVPEDQNSRTRKAFERAESLRHGIPSKRPITMNGLYRYSVSIADNVFVADIPTRLSDHVLDCANRERTYEIVSALFA